MAELDQEYLNTRKATDTWQAQTLTELSAGTGEVVETPGVTVTPDPNDPNKTITTITEPLPRRTELVGDGDGQVRQGRVTESETVTDQPMAAAEGTATESGAPSEPAAQPQGRFTVTDPRINSGQPTPFDSLKDAQSAAGTPDPLAKIEETVGVSPLEGVLKTAEQKDAAKNFVDLLNIPVEHLAGFITKGDVTQTATPDELGAQILAPVVGKLGELLDEKQLGMLTTAVGILGMAVIDPMNPALAAGQVAKAAGKAAKSASLDLSVKPIWELSQKELRTAEKQAAEDANRKLIEAFGSEERAKRWKRLDRIVNSSSASETTIKAAQDELNEIEKVVEPGVLDKLVYGIGEKKYTQAEDYRDFQKALEELDDSSPSALGKSLSRAITDIDDAIDPSKMDRTQLLAYVQIREAFSIASKNGWDTTEVSQAAIASSVKRFADPLDAEFMLQRFAKQRDNQSMTIATAKTILQQQPFKDAVDLLKSERGSFQPVPGGAKGKIAPFGATPEQELQALDEGRKPIVSVTPTEKTAEVKELLHAYEEHGDISWEFIGENQVFYLTKNKADALQRIERLRAVEERIKASGTVTREDVIERGKVYGYSEADIEAFLNQDLPSKSKITGNPYGSSYSTKKQAGASKTPLEPNVSTQVTWEEAVKIDEHQRTFNDGLKTFDERLHAQRGGVQSDVNVFAESIGPDALKMEEFLNLPPGTILKTSDIAAAKRLFTELTEPVRLLAKWLKKNPNDQQAFLAMLEQLPQIDAGLTKIAGVFAEPGRLQRMLALDKPVTGMVKADTPERVRISQPYIKQWLDFFQQQQERAAMGAPAMTQEKMVALLSEMKSQDEILYAAKVLAKPGWWDMFTEFWINGLLSGPVTHATNILSNTATLLWNIPERAVASALSGGAVRPGEAQAMMGGIVESLGDAWALAVKAFKEDESQLGLGKIETPRRAITADALELTGVPGRAVDYLGTVVRLPGRFLMAGDDFFKSIAFRAELRALAKREAFNQINEAGLTGQAAVSKAKEIEAKILANPPESIKDAAQEFAAYTTFTRELGEVGQKVQALAGTPVGRIILPFVRTPTNIFKFAGERTPLALASRAVRDEIAAGGPRRALALAKISLGSMTMGYVATLAANGLITGNGPKDPALRELKKATGWQPNSFKIGDTYVSYSRLEPIGSLFGMAADAADIMGQLDELDAEELASALTVAFARNASSKTFIKGVAETLHAVTSQDVNVVNHYLEKEIPTLIPFSSLLKQTRNVADPVMREVDTVLEAFKNKVPGFSTDLPPHRNLWGEQVIMEGGLGPDFLSPLYTSSVKDDPVSAEIVRLGVPVRKPAKSIDGIQLTPQEYDAYVLLSGGKPILHGMTMKEKIADLMAGALYARSSEGPDGGKATLIRQIVSDYRDRAKYILQRPDLSQEYLSQDFPDLRDSLNAANVQERQKFNAPTTAPGGLTR